MCYLNNDRKVSIGVTDTEPARYSKRYPLSGGQVKLLDAIPEALRLAPEHPMQEEGLIDPSLHTEDKILTPYGWVYITDIAAIGGRSTGSEGAFLVTWDNKVINIDTWLEV
jgi:hypothetical protein